MALQGPEFYDDEKVFKTYLSRRERGENPNDTLEKPVMMELVGVVRGLGVLDLGCGDASIGRELLEKGARSYLGVEASRKMCELARGRLEGTGGAVAHAEMQAWEYPQEAFDLVISRLALHYLADAELKWVFRQVYASLIPGGRFIFSVEHPVITSTDKGWQTGVRQDWVVDDYFSTGPRATEWLGSQVIKHHRTVEDYFTSVHEAGWIVQSLRESRPRRELFQSEETYERRKRIPLFLFIAARRAV